MNDEGQRYQSVWDALEETPESAEQMKVLSALMIELAEHIRGQGWTPAQAARETDVSESRITDLLNGKIESFNKDILHSMLDAVGLRSN
jgi:predicted XRE-type DNA-binding protein